MRLRLQAKYSIIIVALILCVIFAVAGALSWQFRSSMFESAQVSSAAMTADLLKQLKKRGEIVTRLLAENLSNPLYQYDMEAMYQLIKAVQQQDDIAYVYVYDVEGKIVHDGREEIPQFGQLLDDEVSLKAAASTDLLIQTTDQVVDVALPITLGESPLGGVRVGLSLDGIREDIVTMTDRLDTLTRSGWRKSISITLVITTVLLILGIVMAVSIARRLIRPIQILAAHTERIGRRDYEVSFNPRGSDELTDLANAFKRMSQNLQTTTVSKNYVDNIIDSMGDMLIVATPGGKIRTVNKKLCEVLGYSEDELLGEPLAMIFPDDVDEAETIHENLIDDSHFDTIYLSKDGRRIPAYFEASPMRDQNQKLLAVVCVAQDMTDYYRVREQLEDAKNAAESANRAKTSFLANMSHELRTPLNAVIGFSDVLLQRLFGELNEKQDEYVNDILSSGKHLLGLINDILDLSKIEAGKLELEVEPVDLAALLEGSLAVIRERALSHRIQLVLDVSRDMDTVTADERKLKQIVFNLLSNAVKFTPDSGKVGISAKQTSDGWQVAVWDTGAGVPPEDQETIFEEFQQARHHLVNKPEGTGLGLALSRRLVALHGGELWLDSSSEKGSTFIFTLPLASGSPPVEDEPDSTQAVLVQASMPRAGDDALVLVIEDDRKSANLLQIYLSNAGYRVEVAKDGAEGLEKAKNLMPRAVILDILLPKVDGWTFLSKAKQDAAIKDIPVIVASIIDQKGKGFAMGAAEYLTKPIGKEELLKTLADFGMAPNTDRPNSQGTRDGK